MKKTKKFSQSFIGFLAAVTLVAAVIIPESGRNLTYADTNEKIYKQEVPDDPLEEAPESAAAAGDAEFPEELNGAEDVASSPSSAEDEKIPEAHEKETEITRSSDPEGIAEMSEIHEEAFGSAETERKTGSVDPVEEKTETESFIPEYVDTMEEPKEKTESANNEDTALAAESTESPGENGKILEEEAEAAEEAGAVIDEESEKEPVLAEPAKRIPEEKTAGENLTDANSGAVPVSGKIFRIRLVKNKDTVTDSEDGYVITSSISGNAKQKFFAEKVGKNWRFVNTLTGKVLAVTEPDGNGGRFVSMEEPTGGKRELWRLVAYGKGYGLKSVIDGRVLTSSIKGSGNYTILTEGKGVSRQIWSFTQCQESIAKAEITVDTSVGSGAKSLLPETTIRMGGRLLKKDVDYTITGGSMAGTAKATITGIGNYSGKVTRDYEIVEAAGEITDDYYLLVSKSDWSLAIGAQNGGMVNGTILMAEKKTGAESQIFHIRKSEEGYVFTNAQCEKILAPVKNAKGAEIALFSPGKAGCEIRAAVRSNGAFVLRMPNGRYIKNIGGKLVIGNKKVTEGGCFYLLPVSGPVQIFSGSYYIRALRRIRLVVGISTSSKASGAAAIFSKYSDVSSQRFEFIYSGSGYYRIVGEKSRKVLTAGADGRVVQEVWTASPGQRWEPVESAEGYLLKNAEGKVLTVINQVVKHGGGLCVADEDGTTNQLFLLLARGSGEAKKNLVKKPLTIYQGTDYAAVYNYDDYMDHYTNLANTYGTDCVGALKYFVEHGMSEGQHGSKSFDVWCYRRCNPGVRRQLLADIPAYYLHYIRTGKAQGLKASGTYQTTQAANQRDLAWKCYNEYGDYNSRPYSRQMCELLSAAAEVEYQAYGFPKSIIIAMAIKECGFLTFNGGLPPTSNNVLTMNVDMWNSRWRSGWLGGYASVRVPQYDSTLGKLVYGYENVRCYEDIEACMEDFANFKVSLLGPVSAGMSIEEVVDKYLEGYATSPGYKSSILATIKLHQLTRFDH